MKSIEAQEIRITDENGKVCGTLGANDGSVAINLLRSNGSSAIRISVDDDEPKIELKDSDGVSRMQLKIYADEQHPSIELFDSSGHTRVYATAPPSDYGEVGIVDDGGKPLWVRRGINGTLLRDDVT